MDLADKISNLSLTITLGASAILVILVFTALLIKKLSPLAKKLLFFSIVLVIVGTTAFLAFSTIYLNSVSISGGPVHYHADFEIWNCGQELELKDPKGISNKIGTSILHEHNDKRIHLEGVVVEENDASLGKFFDVIGGKITSESLSLPTNSGIANLVSGGFCQDGQKAILQVFAYKTIKDNYYQQKILDPKNYIISREVNVPPADCIIIEYGPFKEKTDKLCRSYKVAEKIGKLKGEIRYGN